jgi:hypothetical protein
MLSGIPATGKSEFGRYLAREHGFAHYDLECHPGGWPHPELMATWCSNRAAFAFSIRQWHERVVLDWGFPISHISWVNELRANGVRLVWFDGDIGKARSAFEQRRSKGPVEGFDLQVAAIQQAGYPAALNCVVVPGLSAVGVFMDQRQIERLVFM